MFGINEFALRLIARLYGMQDEEGQGLAEYGLILALVAIICIAALTALGNGVVAKLNEVTAAL
jgi:pilus assembly protein Flp/PilA